MGETAEEVIEKPEDKRYPYAEALPIAQAVLELLRPHCIRIEIAGSIRRKKPMVGDIEIVAIPKPYQVGLFESGIATVLNKWEKVRGDLTGKSTQRILPEGIALDVFLADEDNWGYIFALRTGSGNFNQKTILTSLKSRGYECDGGYIWRDGEKCEVKEETDLFRMMGIPFIEPEKREL